MSDRPLSRKILVLGASGLIGRFVTDELRTCGHNVTAVARRFSNSQQADAFDLALPIMQMDVVALAGLLREREIDLVVNCVGVLQDGPGSDTRAVHRDLVERLLQAIHDSGRMIRFAHVSIPGDGRDDQTAFSRTKRAAEQLIASSGIAYAILRPGFVIAPAAYGGSAMLRALAALPFDLPAAEQAIPFQSVAAADITDTIAWLAEHDASAVSYTWDLMQPQPITLGQVIAQFRMSLGTAAMPRVVIPRFLLGLGAMLGDIAGWLGWSPPIRSTALAELRRGVRGDPSSWIAATGIAPTSIARAIGRGATIQDKWFARLFLIKAPIIACLVLFWILSGFIAVVLALPATEALLVSHHFPPATVAPLAIGTSVMDMSIGVLIAFRRTCAAGLIAGTVVSLGYMAVFSLLTPDLWLDPLGALVKTGPAIVLMLVALLTLDNR